MEKSFKRHKIKYLITINQYINLMNYLSDKVEKDVFYKSTIYNVYYDTDNFELIRKLIEKPIYKEKLRIRSYNKPTLDSSVYVELTPKMFLSYERGAYYFKTDKQIRITFDTNIKYQTENVSLLPSISGIKLLPNNLVSMELKVPFSKYGTAYKQIHKLSQNSKY